MDKIMSNNKSNELPFVDYLLGRDVNDKTKEVLREIHGKYRICSIVETAPDVIEVWAQENKPVGSRANLIHRPTHTQTYKVFEVNTKTGAKLSARIEEREISLNGMMFL